MTGGPNAVFKGLGFSGARQWVYTMKIKGKYDKVHRASAWLLHAFLFLTPWISIGGHPLLRFDLPARRVYSLGFTFTAADGVLIMIAGLLAAFALFFFTSLFGRLWCGYMCPHSVFLLNWVLPLEQWIEGNYNKRKLRDGKGFSPATTGLKGLKFALFMAVSALLSLSFMGFFVDAPTLWTGQASGASYAVVGFFTLLWFADFAYFREQVCNYICPYARFQSALMDENTLVVSYDVPRGEERGGKQARVQGRCLDCRKCVAVCPQGVDIRDGFQLECISCGRCVDACASAMNRVGHLGLVRYTTLAEEQGAHARWLRPRTVAYAAILTGLITAFVAVVELHSPVELHVNRMAGSLFSVDDDGFVRNTYMVSVTNNQAATASLEVGVDGLPEGSQVSAPPISVTAGGSGTFPVVVRIPTSALHTSTTHLSVRVHDDHLVISHDATFKSPGAPKGE